MVKLYIHLFDTNRQYFKEYQEYVLENIYR